MQFKSYLLLGSAGLLVALGTMAAASGQSTTAKKVNNRQNDMGPVPTNVALPWTATKSANPQSDIGPVPAPVSNLWLCEPLLVFDVSGVSTSFDVSGDTTVSVEVHQSLTLYNNGRVSLAESGLGRLPRVVSKVISVDETMKLYSMLIEQGAFLLTDQEQQVAGVPMHSFSIFSGETNAFVHTFNYWVPEGQFAVLEKTLDEFITRTFPVN